MNNAFSFEEQPYEAYSEFDEEETEFDLEHFQPELGDWKWEGGVGRGQSPAAAKRSSNTARRCPPFKFECDINCVPIFPLGCPGWQKKLCDRILGAIKLATKAAAELEAKPLRPDTVNKFRRIFGQGPSDPWPLSWDPRQTMRAGDIVASRFRTVAKELQTRKTLYRCLCNGGGGGRGREEPYHPTETIVRDPPDPKFPAVAQAVLCKNEVRLCPPFWQLKPEWQEGTILHEMLHLCFGLTCAWFQHDRKEKKRDNAYCYEAFAVGPTTEPMTIAMCDKSPK